MIGRDGTGKLTLNDIDRMRSDAVTEFAYADNGFPIVIFFGNTIVSNPNLFQQLATQIDTWTNQQKRTKQPEQGIQTVASGNSDGRSFGAHLPEDRDDACLVLHHDGGLGNGFR